MVEDKHIASVKKHECLSLHELSVCCCLFYNKTRAKTMHISNHIEYYRNNSIITQAQNTSALKSNLFLTSTLVNGHKQGTVNLSQRKTPVKVT